MSSSTIQRVKPPALRSGDTIGIVAPASQIRREDLESGCEALRRAGYRPFYFDSILERGVQKLKEIFASDDVRAIVCARGGYGANYLLEKLDLRKIAARPKIFVGY